MRIGINIPNELMKRIEPFRSEINLSQVCREAIEKFVMNDVRIKDRTANDGMDEHAMRLANPPLIEPDWVGYALDDARGWVMAVDLEDWDEFWYRHDFFKDRGDDLTWLAQLPGGPDVMHFGHRQSEHKEWFIQQCAVNDGPGGLEQARKQYSHTWLSYVNEVRQKQLQLYEDIHKKTLADRERALRERPEPGVPSHLLP